MATMDSLRPVNVNKMIQNTSKIAYDEVKPSLGEKQAAVMVALGSDSLTNTELATRLGWAINRVTPRVFELRALGRVEQAEKRPCSITGRMAIAWRAVIQDTLF